MQSIGQSASGATDRVSSKLDILEFSIQRGRSDLGLARTQLTDAIFDNLEKRVAAVRDEIVTLERTFPPVEKADDQCQFSAHIGRKTN
jgi:hypothetical protein